MWKTFFCHLQYLLCVLGESFLTGNLSVSLGWPGLACKPWCWCPQSSCRLQMYLAEPEGWSWRTNILVKKGMWIIHFLAHYLNWKTEEYPAFWVSLKRWWCWFWFSRWGSRKTVSKSGWMKCFNSMQDNFVKKKELLIRNSALQKARNSKL